MKIQKIALTIGAVAAFGFGSINPVQAGEFKLLQNFLNSVSIFGGAEPAPNSAIEVGPVIQPGDPKRDREKIRPVVTPANPDDKPVGVYIDPTRKP